MFETVRRSALSGFAAGTLLTLTAAVLCADAQAQCPGGYGGSRAPSNGGRGGASGASGPAGPSTPGPSGPTTPSPGGPGVPTAGPVGPTTGGPAGLPIAGPVTGAPRGAGPRGGMPLVFTHGHTSKQMLEIDWDYPVYEPEDSGDDGQTKAAPVRRALPLEQAWKEMVGDDPRPVLVLRECFECRGSDLALLSREFANERTMLLTDWFHCIKLPANVSEEDHPFHAMFPERTHLFLARADGSERIDFDGMQSQKSLWKAMGATLKTTYKGNPERSVKSLLQLLAQFDVVDDREAQLLRDLDRALETKGPRASKVKKIQAELEALATRRQALLAKEKALRTMPLRQPAAGASK